MKKLSIQDLAIFIGCNAVDSEYPEEGYFELNLETLISLDPDIEELPKPILRPLSDLTEEEKLEMLKLKYPAVKFISVYWNKEFPIFYKAKVEYFSDHTAEWMPSGVEGYLSINPYSDINFKYLIQKHFDVFGWIEKDLAIDKTKL